MSAYRSGLYLVIFLFMAVLPAQLRAQSTGFGLLEIGPNSRALAVNEATTAMLLGGSDLYSNPANLALEHSSSLNVDYSLWIAGIKNTHLALNLRHNSSALAFGILASSADDFELRDKPGPSQGHFSVSYFSLAGAYARSYKNFSLGVTVQYLREETYIYTAGGYAFNAGLSSEWLDKKLRVSVALKNAGSMDKLNLQATTLPAALRAGFSAQLFSYEPDAERLWPLSISLYSDYVHPFYRQNNGQESHQKSTSGYINAGLSVEAAHLLTFFAGYKSGDTQRRFSFGSSIQLRGIQANYALVPFGQGYNSVHSIGLQYNF